MLRKRERLGEGEERVKIEAAGKGGGGSGEVNRHRLGNKSTVRPKQVLISSPGSAATSATARKAWRAPVSRKSTFEVQAGTTSSISSEYTRVYACRSVVTAFFLPSRKVCARAVIRRGIGDGRKTGRTSVCSKRWWMNGGKEEESRPRFDARLSPYWVDMAA